MANQNYFSKDNGHHLLSAKKTGEKDQHCEQKQSVIGCKGILVGFILENSVYWE